MGNAKGIGNAARIVNVLARAAAALPARRRAVVVELQGDADDVVAGPRQECGDNRGIDAARHRDDDARALARRAGRARGVRGVAKRVRNQLPMRH